MPWIFGGGPVMDLAPESLGRMHHNIVEGQILGGERSFIDKLKEQLQDDRALVLLGGEAMVIYGIGIDPRPLTSSF